MIRWSGSWSEDHPVMDGSNLPMFLSIEDAVSRISSGYPWVDLLQGQSRETFDQSIRSRLMDGQSVDGFRLMKVDPYKKEVPA